MPFSTRRNHVQPLKPSTHSPYISTGCKNALQYPIPALPSPARNHRLRPTRPGRGYDTGAQEVSRPGKARAGAGAGGSGLAAHCDEEQGGIDEACDEHHAAGVKADPDEAHREQACGGATVTECWLHAGHQIESREEIGDRAYFHTRHTRLRFHP